MPPEPIITDDLQIIKEDGIGPLDSAKSGQKATCVVVTLPNVSENGGKEKTSPKKERLQKSMKKKRTAQAGISIEGTTDSPKVKIDSESEEKEKDKKPSLSQQIMKNSLAEAQRQ